MSQSLAEFDKLKAQIAAFVAPTVDLVVTDSGTNIMAQGVLKTLTTFKKQIEATRVGIKAPYLETIRQIDFRAGEISAPLINAEAQVKEKMLVWAKAEEAKRIEEQRKIRAEKEAQERAAEAARQAEAAKQRKAEAEAQKALNAKHEAERKVFAEEQRKKKELADAFGVDEAKQAEAAEAQHHAMIAKAQADKAALDAKKEEDRLEAEAKFNKEHADREADARAKEAALEASRPKNTRKNTKWRVKNLNEIPDDLWMINEDEITDRVRKGHSIPGIEVYEEMTVVAR